MAKKKKKQKYIYMLTEFTYGGVMDGSSGDAVCGFYSWKAAWKFLKKNNINGYIKILRVVD